jgi:hypothetical protein
MRLSPFEGKRRSFRRRRVIYPIVEIHSEAFKNEQSSHQGFNFGSESSFPSGSVGTESRRAEKPAQIELHQCKPENRVTSIDWIEGLDSQRFTVSPAK